MSIVDAIVKLSLEATWWRSGTVKAEEGEKGGKKGMGAEKCKGGRAEESGGGRGRFSFCCDNERRSVSGRCVDGGYVGTWQLGMRNSDISDKIENIGWQRY